MRVPPLDDLGRPVMHGRQLVWVVATGRGSRLFRMRLPGGRPTVLVRSPRFRLISSPSTGAGRLAWIEARGNGSDVVKVAGPDGSEPRIVYRLRDRSGVLWGTAITAQQLYVTVWGVSSRRGRIVRVRLG